MSHQITQVRFAQEAKGLPTAETWQYPPWQCC